MGESLPAGLKIRKDGAKAAAGGERGVDQQVRPKMAAAAPACAGRRRAKLDFEPTRLDEVDFGRQVRRHFEADFLLANFRLGPGLHVKFLHPKLIRTSVPMSFNIRAHPDNYKSRLREKLITLSDWAALARLIGQL